VTINSTTGSVLLTQDSTINTVAIADSSNAGDIAISTGGSIIIKDSQVTTVALGGTSGQLSISSGILDTSNASILSTTTSPVADGGNITVEADVLILEETVIQANAISGNGGTITIDSDAVIPFGNQLETQSIERLLADDVTGNVIQAVAESGVSIPPAINAPETDISAAIAELNADPGAAPTVASNPCAGFVEGAPSSLVEFGRGGLPVTDATQIDRPIHLAQDSLTENQVSLTSSDANSADHSQNGCRPG